MYELYTIQKHIYIYTPEHIYTLYRVDLFFGDKPRRARLITCVTHSVASGGRCYSWQIGIDGGLMQHSWEYIEM